MKSLKRTTAAGLAGAAALGLMLAMVPATLSQTQANAAPIVVPSQPAPPPNLALSSAVTASGVELDREDFAAKFAADGSSATRWSSNYADNAWIQLELAQAGPIDHVKITWPSASAKQYTLLTSVDGVNWTEAKVFAYDPTQPSNARVDEFTLKVPNAKFIKMQGSKRWGNYGYSISEFEVYAAPAPVLPESRNLVPQPAEIASTGAGSFNLLPSSQIVASGAAVAPANYFAEKARLSTGFALPVVDGTAGANDIEVAVKAESSAAKAESYTLQADASGAKVLANTAAGALNGVQTLRQLFPQWIESKSVVRTPWTVAGVVISDYPRYEYRGIQIDVARSFYTVDEMKEHIDNAAQFKLNRLHIHLTDDQGWRIAIDQPANNPSNIKYTDLTDISGKTAMTYNDAGVLQGTELGHTGYYTKADYQEIIRYAGVNGMVVVPEIDMPGHTTAALHAIPQLNSTGSAPKPKPGETTAPHQGSGNVGGSTFDADNPATYEFTKEVLTQLAAMTPGPYLHIGGDESHVTPHDKYSKMLGQFNTQVKDTGKTAIGWNEASGDMPAGSVVQYWAGDVKNVANNILANNSKAILSPASKTYIPQRQDSSQTVGGTWACGGSCTLQSHYDWNPENFLPGVTDERILGVETVQWGEWIRGMDQTETMQYPRTLATAEVAWSPQAKKNYSDFSKRVGALGGRMAIQNISHFPTAGLKWTTATPAPATAPAATDISTLPATSPLDVEAPATAQKAGDYFLLRNLPANQWLQLAIHPAPSATNKLQRAAVAGTDVNWVLSDADGNAPVTVPASVTPGANPLTVQAVDGELLAFANIVVAAEPEPTESATPTPSATASATATATASATAESSETASETASEQPTASASSEASSSSAGVSDSAQASVPASSASKQTVAGSGASNELPVTGVSNVAVIGAALLALMTGLLVFTAARRRSGSR